MINRANLSTAYGFAFRKNEFDIVDADHGQLLDQLIIQDLIHKNYFN